MGRTLASRSHHCVGQTLAGRSHHCVGQTLAGRSHHCVGQTLAGGSHGLCCGCGSRKPQRRILPGASTRPSRTRSLHWPAIHGLRFAPPVATLIPSLQDGHLQCGRRSALAVRQTLAGGSHWIFAFPCRKIGTWGTRQPLFAILRCTSDVLRGTLGNVESPLHYF